MINQPIAIFKLMFIVLHTEWENNKSEELGNYLSDADPFIVGNDSVDPVVFKSFNEMFKKDGTYANYGYDFILKYLSELDTYYGDIKAHFLNISIDKYLKIAEKFSNMSDEEVINNLNLY